MNISVDKAAAWDALAASNSRNARLIDCQNRALNLALVYLFQHEPRDSRAVSDEFVAMAAVLAGDTSEHVMAIIDRATSENSLAESSK